MFLTIETGPERGRRSELTGSLLIGRDEGCDLVIPDERVSRRHAILKVSNDGGVNLHDLESTNGTYVDGRRIVGSIRLLGEETVRLGDTILSLSTTVGTPPVPAPIGVPLPRRPVEPSGSAHSAAPPPDGTEQQGRPLHSRPPTEPGSRRPASRSRKRLRASVPLVPIVLFAAFRLFALFNDDQPRTVTVPQIIVTTSSSTSASPSLANLSVGDCLTSAAIDPEIVPCSSTSASYRVVKFTFDPTGSDCPKGATSLLHIIGGLIGSRWACLAHA